MFIVCKTIKQITIAGFKYELKEVIIVEEPLVKIMELAHLQDVHLFLIVNKLITDKTQNIFI